MKAFFTLCVAFAALAAAQPVARAELNERDQCVNRGDGTKVCAVNCRYKSGVMVCDKKIVKISKRDQCIDREDGTRVCAVNCRYTDGVEVCDKVIEDITN